MPEPKKTDENVRKHRRAQAKPIIEKALNADAPERLELFKAGIRQLAEEDRLPCLSKLYDEGAVPGSELWHLLLENYWDINDPYLTCPNLLPMFRAAVKANGRLRDHNEQVPTKPRTMFRAAHPAGRRGLSWSGKREVAEKFLSDPTKRIYSVVAQPEHMLGIFSKIGEYEYFLDYELILEPKEI